METNTSLPDDFESKPSAMPEGQEQIRFKREIEAAATEIHNAVQAGDNNPRLFALIIAEAIEQILERRFPELAGAASLKPRKTVQRLLKLYSRIHEDTANPVD